MYYFLLIASQAVLSTASKAQYEGLVPALEPVVHRPSPGLDGTIRNVCHDDSITTSLEEYPHHALITGKCFREINGNDYQDGPPFIFHGFIISPDYILSYADQSPGTDVQCNYIVDVLVDRSKYEAELIRNGDLALFKLKNPIKKDSKAKPVEMIEAGEGPPLGAEATIIGLFYVQSSDTFRVIPLATGKIIKKQDFSEFYSNDPQSQVNDEKFRDLVWFEYPGQFCEEFSIDTTLLVGGRLAGVEPRLEHISATQDEISTKGFINLARQRATIRQLTGI